MGLSFRASRILERLHKAIQTPGHQSGVHDLGAAFHELRLNGKSTVTKSEFVNVTAADGLLSAEDAGVLFRGLAAGASSGGDGDSASLAEVPVRIAQYTTETSSIVFQQEEKEEECSAFAHLSNKGAAV